LGITTHQGLVLASDSRTNAGYDDVNVCRKMYRFVQPGERVFVILTSGSLSVAQSVITVLEQEFKEGTGLAAVPTLYDAARVVGEQVRHISELDRSALEKDGFRYNAHFILGGQIRGQPHGLYLIYPQGNPLSASEDSPYLQIGECKYGRPILDRGVRYERTSLEEASKYALISIDSTMRSNVTVGPPIHMAIINANDLRVSHYRRFAADDPDLRAIHTQWEQALRKAVQELPGVRFSEDGPR
jgi:putative proteasome-type protease